MKEFTKKLTEMATSVNDRKNTPSYAETASYKLKRNKHEQRRGIKGKIAEKMYGPVEHKRTKGVPF